MASDATPAIPAIPALSQGASVMPPPLPILLPSRSVSGGTTEDTNAPAPRPPYIQPMLVRQIRDQYWLESEEYMRNNPDLKECEVLTNQLHWGWVYRIVREADGTLSRISEYKTVRDFRHPDFIELK